ARTQPRTFAPGEFAEIAIALVDGALEIVLPNTMPATTDSGYVRVFVRCGNDPQLELTAKPPAMDGAGTLEWSSRRIRVGAFMPGEYSVRVSAEWQGPADKQTAGP